MSNSICSKCEYVVTAYVLSKDAVVGCFKKKTAEECESEKARAVSDTVDKLNRLIKEIQNDKIC